jgi:hypothetical protein
MPRIPKSAATKSATKVEEVKEIEKIEEVKTVVEETKKVPAERGYVSISKLVPFYELVLKFYGIEPPTLTEKQYRTFYFKNKKYLSSVDKDTIRGNVQLPKLEEFYRNLFIFYGMKHPAPELTNEQYKHYYIKKWRDEEIRKQFDSPKNSPKKGKSPKKEKEVSSPVVIDDDTNSEDESDNDYKSVVEEVEEEVVEEEEEEEEEEESEEIIEFRNSNPYMSLTKLRKLCNKRGIVFDNSDTQKTLIDYIINDMKTNPK